ncbi:hypothetical protein [Indioceanicola profundi]|uniref:hypothetical protein n=1 Tax=Indioceanicola profundi TaxID=2220096 RepID=UPI000E6ADA2B|nr:hypothetical protein [Indioceanicola profundi]
MPGRSAPIPLIALSLFLAAGAALAQDGEDRRPPLPSAQAAGDAPDALPPDPAPTAGSPAVVAPRADETGPGPTSWADDADNTLDDPRPGGRTVPPPPQADSRSAVGASQSSSIEGPSIFPIPTEPAGVEDQPAGVNAACTALTDAVERDRCRTGSVAGQPDLPPTPE